MRVIVDEVGLTGVAYTVLTNFGFTAPAQYEEVDFVLNRPFLFVVESGDGLQRPLGVGDIPSLSA